MQYVDEFVAAVPNENKEKYIQHATLVDPLFKEFGALKVVECWGDDVPDGETHIFPPGGEKRRERNRRVLLGRMALA